MKGISDDDSCQVAKLVLNLALHPELANRQRYRSVAKMLNPAKIKVQYRRAYFREKMGELIPLFVDGLTDVYSEIKRLKKNTKNQRGRSEEPRRYRLMLRDFIDQVDPALGVFIDPYFFRDLRFARMFWQAILKRVFTEVEGEEIKRLQLEFLAVPEDLAYPDVAARGKVDLLLKSFGIRGFGRTQCFERRKQIKAGNSNSSGRGDVLSSLVTISNPSIRAKVREIFENVFCLRAEDADFIVNEILVRQVSPFSIEDQDIHRTFPKLRSTTESDDRPIEYKDGHLIESLVRSALDKVSAEKVGCPGGDEVT